MRIIDVKQNKSGQLILFFNGWGFDEKCIAHLQTQNYDVKAVNDYRDLSVFDRTVFSAYSSVTVVAWSFGVWVANAVLGKTASGIYRAYAINGTLRPVDDLLGIPEKIFSGTLNTLSESSYLKFQERVMGGVENFRQNEHFLPTREFAEQKQELECLSRHFAGEPTENLNWNKAICGNADRIFPFKNQLQFWGDKAIEKPFPHFVFDRYETWEALLNDFEND